VTVRIQLGGTELARVRFAVSPVYETVMALDVLRRPGVHAVHVPWARGARLLLADEPGLALLWALVGNDRTKPSFLMPAPDSRLPDLDTELRRVRATPAARVREDLEPLMAKPTRVLREFHDDPRAGLPYVVSALRSCHELIVAPHWTRMVRLLDADIAHRAATLADGGVERLFADLHPEVGWVDGELVIYPNRTLRTTRVTLSGRGLVLCPSVFCWPRVTTAVRPAGPGTLRYPARGVATLWESTGQTTDALAALIGRTRATMLVLLAQPATTTDLATRLAVTPGAVSQHLGVLRDAGLVATRRDGRAVLHLRTDRADALLA